MREEVLCHIHCIGGEVPNLCTTTLFCWSPPASGINSEGSKDKLRRVLDLVWEVGPINTGSNEVGTILSGVSVEEIKAGFTSVPRVRCCFDSADKIREILRRLLELDLGISVVVSGPRLETEAICREFGIQPHSANFSLDIWGKQGQLPPEEVLEFITMCGHGMFQNHWSSIPSSRSKLEK